MCRHVSVGGTGLASDAQVGRGHDPRRGSLKGLLTRGGEGEALEGAGRGKAEDDARRSQPCWRVSVTTCVPIAGGARVKVAAQGG